MPTFERRRAFPDCTQPQPFSPLRQAPPFFILFVALPSRTNAESSHPLASVPPLEVPIALDLV